jgi:hypothetical protein
MIDKTKKYEAMYLNKPKRRNIVSLRHLTRQKALVESDSNEIVETTSFHFGKRRLVLFNRGMMVILNSKTSQTQSMYETGEIQVLPKMKNPF